MDQEKQQLNEEQSNTQEEIVNEVVEETASEETVMSEEQPTEEQKRIQELENEVSQLNDRLLRVQADYDNFRRRSREEKEAAAKYRAQNLIEEIIPVIDNFDRALSMKAEGEEAKALLQGMEMVYRQLNDALKNEGLDIIDCVGQSFDPHVHQAVMQVETDEFESNQVVEQLQKGYKLKDRVIRPAMVKVNQ